MPIKTGKLKDKLTAPELRRMIKKHNKLMSITIPPKTDRDGLIKLITDNGFDIDHDKQLLIPRVKMKRKQKIKLPPAPTPKTVDEKKEAKQQKKQKTEEQETKGFEARKKKIEAVKKLRSKPLKEKPSVVEDIKAETLKYIRDNKKWLVPSRMADPYKNRYNYYLERWKKNNTKLQFSNTLSSVEIDVEYFKSGKQDGIVNPFAKKKKK